MQVTDYLSAVPIGLLIGVLGRLVLPGRQRIGIFVTFLVGIGSALLGSLLAGLLNVDDRGRAEVLFLRWSWAELAIQVGFAVVGIGLANILTYTKLADRGERPTRRKPRKRRAKSASSD